MLEKVGAGPLPRVCPSPQGCKARLGQLRGCLSPRLGPGRAFLVGLPETPSPPVLSQALECPGPGWGEGAPAGSWHPQPPSFRVPPAGLLKTSRVGGLTFSVWAAQRSLGTGAVGGGRGPGSPGSSGPGGGGAGWVVGLGSPGRLPRAATRLAVAGLLEAVGDEWKAREETADSGSPRLGAWVSQPEQQPDSWRRPGPVHLGLGCQGKTLKTTETMEKEHQRWCLQAKASRGSFGGERRATPRAPRGRQGAGH